MLCKPFLVSNLGLDLGQSEDTKLGPERQRQRYDNADTPDKFGVAIHFGVIAWSINKSTSMKSQWYRCRRRRHR